MKTTVLIAGAGPCGTVLAWNLAKKGMDTIVVEKMSEGMTRHEFIADVPGFLMNIPAMSDLPKDCVGTLANFLLARGPGMPMNQAIRLPRPDYVPLYLDRVVKFMRNKATSAGARIIYDARLKKFEKTASGMAVSVTINGRNQKIMADLVVDCSGGRSELARQAGLPIETGDEVRAYRGVYQYDPDSITRAIGETIFPYGNSMLTGFAASYSTYNLFWDPAEQTIDVLAGGRADKTDPIHVINSTKASLKLRTQVHGSGGVIMLRRPHFRVALDGFMVLGEAAGHINTAHGSGVAASMMAAGSAAKIINYSLERGGPTQRNLENFGPLFFSNGGNVLAYYYEIYRFASNLKQVDIHDLFMYEGINARTIKAAFEQRIPKTNDLKSIVSALHLLARPGLAIKGMRATRLALRKSRVCC